MLSCAAVIPDESAASQTVKIAEYVLKKTGNADSVTFTLTDGSAVDGNDISGSFVVDIAPVGEAPKLVFGSSFDSETRTLTLDVSVTNIKGHTTFTSFVDFPADKLEYVSTKNYDGHYVMIAGMSEDSNNKLYVAAMTSTVFAENTIKFATFTFKVKDGVDSVKFSVNSDSVADDVIRIEPGDYTVSTKSRSTTDPAADVRFAFDPSTRLLTATVTALNLKGHTTALIFLDFNKSEVEFASARKLYISDSEIDVVCGLTTDGMNLASAILKSRSTFTEDSIDISEFTLHVKPGVEKVTLTVANDSAYDDKIPVTIDSFTFNVLGDSSGSCTHINTKTEPALAPTCTADGHTEKIICLDCGKVIKDSEPVSALGHKEVKVFGKSATCTETGLTDGTKCSVCGKVIKAQKETPILGHKLVTSEGKPATCTDIGFTDEIKCSVCGEIIKAQEEIPALGHSFENGVCTVCSAKDPDYTLKLVEDHDKNISLDNEKKTVTSKPTSSKSMTASELKKQFGADIKLDLKDDDLVPNGTKFTYNDVEYTIIVKGDTAADGKITASDARAILRMAAKLDNPDDVTAAAADLNSDGKISSSEARNVLRFAAKLSSSLEG